MMFLGVANNVAVGQAIRVAEPWTGQTRTAAVGLLILVGALVWSLVRVSRRR